MSKTDLYKTDLYTATFGEAEDGMNNSPHSDDYIYYGELPSEHDNVNHPKHYISRWHKKNGIEDLKKAQWYLNHLINHCKEDSED